MLGRICQDDAVCREGQSCRPAQLCVAVNPNYDPRVVDHRAGGACTSDADCEDGRVCDSSPRCDPDTHRVDPEGRTRPAILHSPGTVYYATCGGCCGVFLLVLAALGFLVWRRRQRE